ncbi:MAG: hypothetical protein Q9181_001355 [Wetmoreana brouardii]
MNACQSLLRTPSRSVSKGFGQQIACFPLNWSNCHLNIRLGRRHDSASAVPPSNGSSSKTEDRFVPYVKERPEDTKDIYVNDLEATLEAHRATNRARVIRRVYVPTDPGFLRPDVEQSNEDAEVDAERQSNRTQSQDFNEQAEAVVGNPEDVNEERSSFETRKVTSPKLWEFWPAGTIQYQELGGPMQRGRSRGALEYYASARRPLDTWEVKRVGSISFRRPWLGHMEDWGGDSLQRLGNEIEAYERYMTPSSTELKATRKVALHVNRLVTAALEGSSCEVIGSYSTGLALPSSDIDVSVFLPAIEADAAPHRKSLRGLRYQKMYLQALRKLSKAMRSDSDFGDTPEIVHARVPIVRAIHQETGQEVQIQIWTGVRRQEQHTLAYLAEYPTLRPLYFVLRSCLKMRQLSFSLEGGLGAYATLMLIVNALKHTSGQYDPLDVGKQLLHVLQFYAESDLYRYGFSVDPPRKIVKGKKHTAANERVDSIACGINTISRTDPRQPYLLCLQDPADPSNDLGIKAYAIKHIQKVFARARSVIIRQMESWDSGAIERSDDMKRVALLGALVQANYRLFSSNRDKISRYGSLDSSRAGIRWGGRKQAPEGSRQQPKVSAREMLDKVVEFDKRKAAECTSQNSQLESGTQQADGPNYLR